jgi:hypothetical protein
VNFRASSLFFFVGRLASAAAEAKMSEAAGLFRRLSQAPTNSGENGPHNKIS